MEKRLSDSKKLTLIYLQQLFLEKTNDNHFVRMPEILSYLEARDVFVDRRTIYTDIKLLNHAGFEIEGVQEKGGYKYHHINRTFDTNELKIMIDSVAASKYLTERKSKELISKIKSLGSSFDSAALNRHILLGKRIKSMNNAVLKTLDTIHAAISSNSVLSFEYTRWSPKKTLECTRKGEITVVSPYAITLSDDNYYLIAYDHKYKDLRHFRIDKMRSLALLPQSREGAEHFKSFDIVDYTQKSFGMYGGKETTLRIRCINYLVGVFIDRFGKDISIRPDLSDSRYSIIRITVLLSDQFYAWLFGLGKKVKILSPDSAIEEYTQALEKLVTHYRPQ